MIVNSVEAERIGLVYLAQNARGRMNRITVLTGPNGSGKTEILATIANVFHGALHSEEARVRWTRRNQTEETTYKNRDSTGRVRVVAQTFSPFSRFPSRLHPDPDRESVIGRYELSKEQYVGVGFNSHTRLNIQDFSRLIIENGILRLSEQPKAARAVFRVLQELDFKEGMLLRYRSNNRLEVLKAAANRPRAIENAFVQLREGTELQIEGQRVIRTGNLRLKAELRRRDPYEVAEFVRGAIGLIQTCVDNERSVDYRPTVYSFNTFREHSMVSDFSVIQAFSILRQLGLLELLSCQLTPIGRAPIDVTLTSSGQQQLLCSFFGLAASLEDDAIVLIDEPELSLHPRWQLNFLKHLEHVLEAFSGCHVIIATHSPLITQSAVSHGADIVHLPTERAFVQPKNRVNLSVEEALVDIFETPLPNSLHIANEIFELISKAETGNIFDKHDSKRQLETYLELYQRGGEGSLPMVRLLEKALRLIASGN